MLGIDRQQLGAARLGRLDHQMAGRDQGLLVGERDGAAAADRRHGRAKPGAADDRRHRPVGAGAGGLEDGLLAGRGFGAASRQRRAQSARARPRRRSTARRGADPPGGFGEAGDVAMGGDGEDLVALRGRARSGRASSGRRSRWRRGWRRCAAGSREAGDQDEQGGEDDRQQAVEPVEHSAMAGKQGAAVLDPEPALDAGSRRGRRAGRAGPSARPARGSGSPMPNSQAASRADHGRAGHAADQPGPGLVGADLRRELRARRSSGRRNRRRCRSPRSPASARRRARTRPSSAPAGRRTARRCRGSPSRARGGG